MNGILGDNQSLSDVELSDIRSQAESVAGASASPVSVGDVAQSKEISMRMPSRESSARQSWGSSLNSRSRKNSTDLQTEDGSQDLEVSHQQQAVYSSGTQEDASDDGHHSSPIIQAEDSRRQNTALYTSDSEETVTSSLWEADSRYDWIDEWADPEVLLEWHEMDDRSQMRLEVWYKRQGIQKGSALDLKLRKDLWKVLRLEGIDFAVCQDLNNTKIYCRACDGSMKSAPKCKGILVSPEKSHKVNWATLKCRRCTYRRQKEAFCAKGRDHDEEC